MPKTCCECRYACGPVPVEINENGSFFCHRMPPQRHLPEWHGTWPLVQPNGWCGEYKHGTPTPTGATP